MLKELMNKGYYLLITLGAIRLKLLDSLIVIGVMIKMTREVL